MACQTLCNSFFLLAVLCIQDAGIHWDTKVFDFSCCQFRVFLDLKNVPVRLRTWHHVCFAANLTQRHFWATFDDWFEEGSMPSSDSEELYVQSGGRLVIGQELDTLEGGFSYRQSTNGAMAQFQFFSEALDSSYGKAYTECKSVGITVKPLISFEEDLTRFQLSGSVNTSVVSQEDICKKRHEALFMLPEKRIFRIARDACAKMKGTLAVPQNEVRNTQIFDEISMFNDFCVDAYGTIYWVGGQGDIETGKWNHVTDNTEISWSKFALAYENVSEEKRCISVGGIDFPYFWYATDCEFQTCPLCNFSDDAYFTVRGLCKDTLVDRSFSLHDYKNFKPQFVGDYYTRIFWSIQDSTWMLDSRAEENLFGIMEMTSKDDYPVGVKSWNITGDKCLSSQVEILITTCNSSEYSCDDGMCITKDQRCDMTLDCPDKSDEERCNVVLIPFGYSSQLPPPMEGNSPVSIRFFLGITSIREINILGFKMMLDVVIELRWRDRRLQMKNLRRNTRANKVQDPDEVWQPTMQIEDGSSSLADLMLRFKSLMVEKEHNPLPDDETRLHEDEIYLGSENTLFLQEVQTIGFTCQFQLQRYPFDKQMCSLTFRLIDVSQDFVILTQNGMGVDFLGQRRLLEYEIIMVNMTQVGRSQGVPGQKVAIELRNLYGYYISNTYIPTTLLLIICYLTLFFDLDDFTDRVMVSLTSLLVLSALFTQTSQSIPKTSYLKLIDLWFVVLIIFVFIIVLILVIIENLRLKMNSQKKDKNVFIVVKPEEKIGSGFSSPVFRPTIWSPFFLNFSSQIILPVFILFFIVVYASICYAGL